MRHSLRWATIALALAVTPPLAEAQTADAVPKQISVHKDWSVYEVTDSRGRICYVATEPKEQAGNYSRRDPPALLVARLPGDPPPEQVSVQPGYSFLKGSVVEASVSSCGAVPGSACSSRRPASTAIVTPSSSQLAMLRRPLARPRRPGAIH